MTSDSLPDDVRVLLATVVEALTTPGGFDPDELRDRAISVRGTLGAVLDHDAEPRHAVTMLRRHLDETAIPGDRDEMGGTL